MPLTPPSTPTSQASARPAAPPRPLRSHIRLLLRRMSNIFDLLQCFCARESIVVEGVSYRVLEHLAEGYVAIYQLLVSGF